MTLPKTTRCLIKVTYPSGAVAYAPVFLDGSYYGRADVEAGHATGEMLLGEPPLDRYYEWAAHTPTEIMEQIEKSFARILKILGPSITRQVIERLCTSEIYTHFRRTWEEA